MKLAEKGFLVILGLIFILLKIPILNTPYHWDATVFIPFVEAIFQNNLNPIVTSIYDPGHPPLFAEILAINWKIWGKTLVVSHSIVIAFAVLALWYTYLIGKALTQHWQVGLLAALLLMFEPLFFAQSGMLLLDIPLMTFTVMTLYYVERNIYLYLLAGSAMVLTKVSGVIVILPILLYIFIANRKKGQAKKKLLIYSIPLAVLISWICYHWWQTGLILQDPVFSHTTRYIFHYQRILDVLYRLLALTFYRDGKILLTLCIVLSLLTGLVSRLKTPEVLWDWTKSFLQSKELLLVLVVVIYFLAYAPKVQILDRYFLPLFPIVFVFAGHAMYSLLYSRSKVLLSIVLASILSLFIWNWQERDPQKWWGSFEHNLGYLDVVATHKAACQYIEYEFPEAIVLTDWPQVRELSLPYLGYVTRPIKTYGIRNDISRDRFGIRYFRLEDLKRDDFDIFYYSPQSDHGRRYLTAILKRFNLKLLKRFEKNGKFAEIYS